MEKRGARAVVVSGAIALVIAGIVFLFLKWRTKEEQLVSSGSGSGSWLASLGIGATAAGPSNLRWDEEQPMPEPPQQRGAGTGVGSSSYVSVSAPTTAPAVKPPTVPIARIEVTELPSIFPEDEFGVPIGQSQFATPARAKGFDDTAQALKDGAFSDERVLPSLSTKNGGMLSTLDVRGDYAAPVLFDPSDRTCGSCDKQCVLDGKWNQSSAQRNIDLGIIKEERRRRIVFADE
jgi:hypothetical protein